MNRFMPTLKIVQESGLELAAIRDLEMIWDAECELVGKWLWPEYPRSVQRYERLLRYNDEVVAVVSMGVFEVRNVVSGSPVRSEIFLVVKIPLAMHSEVSRRMRMYEQKSPSEFYETEIKNWPALDLSTGEVLAWWGVQDPSPDELILKAVEDQYQVTLES
jgi:hypothetical protein